MATRSIESRCVDRDDEARMLAETASCALTSKPIESGEHRIVLLHDRAELWTVENRRHGMPLSFREIDRRTGTGNLSHKQPIGRAIGSRAETIIDATAGFGHDAALLACMGWQVTAVERDPFLAAMVQLSLTDAKGCEDLWDLIGFRMSVVCGDSKEYLQTHTADVVYLDPMFAGRSKRSALPKKAAQVLQTLASPSDDAALLAAASHAANRVVVKRPSGSPPIDGGADPDLCFGGRLIRYDVYVTGESS